MSKYYCNNLYLFLGSFLSISCATQIIIYIFHYHSFYFLGLLALSLTENLLLNPGPFVRIIIRQDVNMLKPRRAGCGCFLMSQLSCSSLPN